MIHLLVGLKIPDTTAITAKKTLIKLGKDIKDLKRYQYYGFDIEDDKGFTDKIQKADILVNSNKNTSKIIKGVLKLENAVLIQDKDDRCEKLLKKLKDLGFDNIRSMQRGVIWVFDGKDITGSVEEVLYNKHYQKAAYL